LDNTFCLGYLVAWTGCPISFQAGASLVVEFNGERWFLCMAVVGRAGKSMVGFAVQIPTQEGAHRAAAVWRARLRCSAFMLGHFNTPILCHSLLLPTCIFPAENGAPVWYQVNVSKVIEPDFVICAPYPVVAICRIAKNPSKDLGAPPVYHNCASMSRQQSFVPSGA
jgi:hypothetical protein